MSPGIEGPACLAAVSGRSWLRGTYPTRRAGPQQFAHAPPHLHIGGEHRRGLGLGQGPHVVEENQIGPGAVGHAGHHRQVTPNQRRHPQRRGVSQGRIGHHLVHDLDAAQQAGADQVFFLAKVVGQAVGGQAHAGGHLGQGARLDAAPVEQTRRAIEDQLALLGKAQRRGRIRRHAGRRNGRRNGRCHGRRHGRRHRRRNSRCRSPHRAAAKRSSSAAKASG